MTAASSSGVVVIGVGNQMRRDDGVGLVVVAGLRDRDLPGVRLVDSDGEATALIEAWDGVDLTILVDAVRVRSPRPGTVHWHDLGAGGLGRPNPASGREAQREAPLPLHLGSHAVDLGDVLALAQALDRLPRALELYTVEVADTGFGPELSPAVAAAAAGLVDRIAARLGGNGRRPPV